MKFILKMKKKPQWHKLDNAAKIFPANTDKRDTKVFRFSCELYDEVTLYFYKKHLKKHYRNFLIIVLY